MKKARIKVSELNSRFADWYYVISEDVYKKLRLSRTQLVQTKAAGAGDQKKDDLSSFRELQQQGLSK